MEESAERKERLQKEAWHILRAEDVVTLLGSNAALGLSREEAAQRLAQYGPNKVEEEHELRIARLFFTQIRNPLVFLLIAAGAIAFLLGLVGDAIIIGIAVFINALIGMIQEGRASRALEKLREVYITSATILREGKKRVIDAVDVVPGDILILEAGMNIQADARILEASRLAINEAAITGESQPQEKEALQDDDPARPVADQRNMLFAGTLIEEGRAKAIAVRTGAGTEYGRIVELIAKNHSLTPFQRHMEHLSAFLGKVIVGIALLLFAAGILRGEELASMFLVTIAVIVSVVPEGLPVAVSVILAIGMERMLRQGALVRKLKSVETLGAASVILTDKTGTLTEGTMAVEEVGWIDGVQTPEEQAHTLMVASLTSSAFVENPEEDISAWRIHGSSTERAVLLAAARAGISRESMLKTYPEFDFFAFHPQLRLAASLHQDPKDGQALLFVTGAPETILAYARIARKAEKEVALKADVLEEIKANIQRAAGRGLRLLACAEKRVSERHFPKKVDSSFFEGLILVGMIAFYDPLRADAARAFADVQEAGVRVVMVTGDHGETARWVGEKLGMDAPPETIMEGEDLEKCPPQELQKRLTSMRIFARILPHQKSRIVEAWQREGAVVAMIGDGINDAPALKKADIGVAVGSATDVAKEVSDLVLLQNSFGVLVAAIREGRVILDNVRKVVTLLLSTAFTEIILIGGALLGGLPIPLLPVQILWTNLVGEGLLNFAYAFEPEEGDVMRRRPRQKSAPFFTREMLFLIFAVGIFTDLVLASLFFYLFFSGWDMDHIRSLLFVGLVLDTIFFVFALRSFSHPFWRIPVGSNPYLLIALVLNLALLASAFFIVPLRTLLHLVPLSAGEVMILLGLGIGNLAAIEFGKWIIKRFHTRIS